MRKIQMIRVVIPFLLALVIAYLAKRPVGFLERKKVNRSLAILLVYLGLIGCLGLGILLVAPGFYRDVVDMMEVMPEIYARYQPLIDRILGFLSVEQAVAVLQNSVTVLVDCFMSFILAFYLIRDRQTIKQFLLSFFPVKVRAEAAAGLADVSRIISSFVTGQMVVAVLIGGMETAALCLLGAKYAFLLGFVGGLSNLIPVIGPLIGAVPAVALALLESPYQALLTAAVFVIVQQIDNNFLTPRIVEGRLGLHPLVTVSVVFIAGIFWGIGGVLLSIPLTAVSVSVIRRIYLLRIHEKSGAHCEKNS